MSDIKLKELLSEIYTRTKNIETFLESHLDFNTTMDYIEKTLDERENLIAQLSDETKEKSQTEKDFIDKIYRLDQVIIEKMSLFMLDDKNSINELKTKRGKIKKANFVKNKYISINKNESGFFIDKKK